MQLQLDIHVSDLMLSYLISVGKNGPWISPQIN